MTLRAVRVWLWASLLLSLLSAALLARVAPEGVSLLRVPWVLHAIAPESAALVLLACGRVAMGLGVALAAASLALALTAWSFGTLAFFGLPSVGASLLGIAGSSLVGVPIQVFLLRAAWRARGLISDRERHASALEIGAGAAVLWILVPVLLVPHLAGTRGAASVAAEDPVRARVEAIARCAREHAAQHPDAGVPATLEALGPAGDGCLDAAGAAGAAGGYRFEYLAGVPDASGRIERFVACARPAPFGEPGVLTFVADESGHRAEGVPGDADAVARREALPCAAAWFRADLPAEGLAHCLHAFAAAHPAQGYPRSLEAVAPDGDGCLAGAPLLTGFAPDHVDLGGVRLRYAPEAAGADGRIRGFALEQAPVP
ncbi:MAG TPA: hypothetical protein VMW35_04215 [Myxococcota bacterium]|nr:hypothetical protein [Myxococcota bacterium]